MATIFFLYVLMDVSSKTMELEADYEGAKEWAYSLWFGKNSNLSFLPLDPIDRFCFNLWHCRLEHLHLNKLLAMLICGLINIKFHLFSYHVNSSCASCFMGNSLKLDTAFWYLASDLPVVIYAL